MQTSLKQFLCVLFIQFAAIGCALAQERGTADQAKALVEKGLSHHSCPKQHMTMGHPRV